MKAGPTEPAAEALLRYLRRPGYAPLSQRRLMKRLRVAPEQRKTFLRLIERLLRQGTIVKVRGGGLAVPFGGETRVGILRRHRDGHGFLIPDGGGPDVFLAPRQIAGHLSGDRLAVRVTARGRGERWEGVVTRTLERRSRRVLGVFRRRGRGGVVLPFEPLLTTPIRIPAAFRLGAEDDQVVTAEILEVSPRAGPRDGKILELHGGLDDPGVDETVVARKYGLRKEFPRRVLRAAERLPTRIGSRSTSGRVRFPTAPVTIDGEAARDFDDAVAVESRRGGGFRLYVHIADVAHFVTAGSELDEEALRRGTSVYFPGRVLPMFPEELSNDLCSLRPGVDRLVQSVILDLGPRGRVERVQIADGVIRSAARLTYEQVGALLGGRRRVRGIPNRVVPMLRVADRLRRLLERRRRKRGGVDFDLPEPRILLDVEGAMTGVVVEPRNRAHRMIEEFMLLANEAVARYLEKRKAGCLYRVHESPDPARLETLSGFVKGLGLSFEPDLRKPTPRDLRRLLESAERGPEFTVVSQAALRAMKQARYSTNNLGHFSLALSAYTHFTSPIRRYPDLVVHRALRAARDGSGEPIARGVDLVALAERCTVLERNAEAAERELLAWKKASFAREKVGATFDGRVTGVAPFGLFLQTEEHLIEGLLRVELLGPERFAFDDRRMELRGQRTGHRVRLGDRIRVRITRVDPVLRRVDFAPSRPDGTRD